MKKTNQARTKQDLKMTKKRTSLQKIKVSLLTLSLIHTSLPIYADNVFEKGTDTLMHGFKRTNTAKTTGGAGAKTIMGALNLVSGLSKQMYQNGKMNPAEIKAMHGFNQSKQDAMTKMQSRRMHPAFNCPLPPEPILAPNGACGISAGQMKIPEQALEFGQKVLNEYMTFKKPRNAPPYLGEQCMTDGLKSLEDNFQTMTSQYEQMISQYEAELKKVAEVQKMNHLKIKELNGFLNGGGNSISQDFKNTDFNKMVPNECVDAYDVNAIVKKGGFVAFKDQLTKEDREARKYRGNSLLNTKRQIEADKKKIAARLEAGGVNELSRKDLFRGTKFASIYEQAQSKSIGDTSTQVAKVQKIIESMGVKDSGLVSPEDPNFLIKVKRLADKSQGSFQDQFVLDCMTGRNEAAYSTPLSSDFGKQFTHVKLANKGDRLISFNKKTSAAFNSPSSLSGLDNSINSISDSDIRITVQNESNKAVTKSLKEYYTGIRKECTAIFEGKLKPAGNVAKLETYRAEAKTLEKEAKKLHEMASRSLASGGEGSILAEIDDLIYNCGGKSVEISSCNSKDTYNQSSDMFCVTKAAACASNLNKCEQFTQNLVQQKTQEMKVKADLYNSQMQAQEEKAKAIMMQMQQHMNTVADRMYKQMFPNMTPDIAKAFGLPSMPGLKTVKLTDLDQPKSDKEIKGVFLEKNPEDFMKSMMAGLNGNSKNLKKNLDKWFKDQKKHIADQVNVLNAARDTEVQKWQQFVTDCKGQIQKTNEALAKQNADAQKAAAESAGKQKQFCQKLRGLQESSTGPGCSGDNSAENLYSEAIEISSLLQAQSGQFGASGSTMIFEQINEYRNLCAEVNAEGQDGEQSSSDAALEDACNGSSASEIIAEMTESLKENLHEKEDEEIITELLKKETNIRKKLKDYAEDEEVFLTSPTIAKVRSIKSLQSKGEFCKKLDDSGENYAERTCASNTDKDNCMTKAREKYMESTDRVKLVGLSKVATLLDSMSRPERNNAWSDIGEKYSGTACAAINGSQFGSKGGLIPGMFEKIQRDLASDGIFQ